MSLSRDSKGRPPVDIAQMFIRVVMILVVMAGIASFASSSLICTPVNGWKDERSISGTGRNGIAGQARVMTVRNKKESKYHL